MKLRSKTILGFIAAMSALSLLCVGFASWATMQNDSVATGTISAENVSNWEEYLEINHDGIEGAEYTANGFGLGGGSFTDTITVPVTLHSDRIKEFFNGVTSVTLTVTMNYYDTVPTENNIFAGNFIAGSWKDGRQAIEGKTENSFSVSATVDLSKGGDITVNACFTLTFQDRDEFTKYFYEPLQTHSFAFHAEVGGNA